MSDSHLLLRFSGNKLGKLQAVKSGILFRSAPHLLFLFVSIGGTWLGWENTWPGKSKSDGGCGGEKWLCNQRSPETIDSGRRSKDKHTQSQGNFQGNSQVRGKKCKIKTR